MMKKILLGFLTFFVVVVVGAGGLLWYGKSAGEAKLRDFFTMAKGASPAQLEAQLDDGLKEDVDGELCAAFVKEVATRYGDFKSVQADSMEFSDNLDMSKKRLRTFKGKFEFEKRALPMKLEFTGEKLSTVTVDDPVAVEIADAINRVPARTDAYQKRGERFFEAVLNGKDEDVFALMSEDLQKKDGRAGVASLIKQLAFLGGVKQIDFVSAAARPNTPDKLEVVYRVRAKNGQTLKAIATYQFFRLRGYLVGYETVG